VPNIAVDHELGPEPIHRNWDNSRAPILTIDSGQVVKFRTYGVGDGWLTPDATPEILVGRTFMGHPLTGPVAVRGARAGDTLQIDVLDIETVEWGYTYFNLNRGLLGAEIDHPYLKAWDLSDGKLAWFNDGIAVPIEPFLGVMGVVPAAAGEHSTMPPRRVGGNIDIKQLTAGSTLWLPIEANDALFSTGDGHAAQGDGEVCVTAIECGLSSTLRFTLRSDLHLNSPELRTSGPITPRTNTAGWHATTGVAPDLMDATRAAVRAMIAYLGREHGLSFDDAYILSSVAVDLKISEVVDAPNWIVSAFLPLSIFTK
jgi:acetamidase/formamidase